MKAYLFVCVIALILTLCSRVSTGQITDSVGYESLTLSKTSRRHAYRYIVPVTLIAAGTITLVDKDGDEFIFNNAEVREERYENFRNFATHLDDYLQHAPSLTTFLLGLGGVKGKHDLSNQAALYLKSELLMMATVYTLKNTVGEGRPDSGRRNSFPSGHTAQAFVAASFLAKEYSYKSSWISIGACRMLNNRHWLSDVIVGAGIGILSTEIVYHTQESLGTRVQNRGAKG